MARLFDDADLQWLSGGMPTGLSSTGVPLTMACWFYNDTAATYNSLVSVNDASSSRVMQRLGRMSSAHAAASKLAAITIDASSSSDCFTTAATTVNTWHHGCAWFQSVTPYRKVFLDGGNSSTSTQARTITGIDSMAMGSYGGTAPGYYMSGSIAEVGIWNVVLSDTEVAILAKGVSPLLVRPDALVFYMPGVRSIGSGDDQDIVSGLTLTSNATSGEVTTFAHPRVIYPPQRQGKVYVVPATAGTTFQVIIS